MRGAEQRGVTVNAQHFAAVRRRLEHAMLDVIHCEPHHSQRVRVCDVSVPGQIQSTDHTAARIENGSRITTQDSVRLEEMFSATNLDSAALRKRCADRIRSGRSLVPGDTW